jgi:hypothetical protein
LAVAGAVTGTARTIATGASRTKARARSARARARVRQRILRHRVLAVGFVLYKLRMVVGRQRSTWYS